MEELNVLEQISSKNTPQLIKHFYCISITHNTSSIESISNFTNLSYEKIKELKEIFNIKELFYLSTCNRVEFWVYNESSINKELIESFLKAISNDYTLDEFLLLNGNQAIRHIFNVCSSLDSAVIGEKEIFYQIKKSIQQCLKHKLIKGNLIKLIDHARSCGKKVHTETTIAHKKVSIASVACFQLRNELKESKPNVLIIGAGETIQLFTKYLEKHELGDVTIFNRTLSKAESLAQQLKGIAHPLEDLGGFPVNFDFIVTCIEKTKPILNKVVYEALNNDNEPKIIIDLGVPSNVSNDLKTAPNVSVIDIQKIKSIADKNINTRQKEFKRARSILNNEINEYYSFLEKRTLVNKMKIVFNETRSINEELLNELNIDDTDEAKRILDYFENKLNKITMELGRKLHYK